MPEAIGWIRGRCTTTAVIITADARLPDRPLGACSRRAGHPVLRRVGARVRARLPAAAQRRGRHAARCLGAVGPRRAAHGDRLPPRAAASLPAGARVAALARRRAGAAPALRPTGDSGCGARLLAGPGAARAARRGAGLGDHGDLARGRQPRAVRARLHGHAGRLLRQPLDPAGDAAHALGEARRALRDHRATARRGAPVRPVRTLLRAGAAGRSGAGPDAAPAQHRGAAAADRAGSGARSRRRCAGRVA